MNSQANLVVSLTTIGSAAFSVGAVLLTTFRHKEKILIWIPSDVQDRILQNICSEFIESVGRPLFRNIINSVVFPIYRGLISKITSPCNDTIDNVKNRICNLLNLPLNHRTSSVANQVYSQQALQVDDKIMERKQLIDAIELSLATEQTPSVILTGPPGVGKSSLVTSLVARLQQDPHPALIGANIKQVWQKLLGDLDQINQLFEQTKSDNSILFFDEFNTIIASDENMRLREELKTKILESRVRIIACTTQPIKTIDPAFLRRFIVVEVPEPKGEDLIRILSKNISSYSKTHHCVYEDDVIQYCIGKTETLKGYQPAKSLRLLDLAGSNARKNKQHKVTTADIDEGLKVANLGEGL